jgi:hypothetical protein
MRKKYNSQRLPSISTTPSNKQLRKCSARLFEHKSDASRPVYKLSSILKEQIILQSRRLITPSQNMSDQQVENLSTLSTSLEISKHGDIGKGRPIIG